MDKTGSSTVAMAFIALLTCGACTGHVGAPGNTGNTGDTGDKVGGKGGVGGEGGAAGGGTGGRVAGQGGGPADPNAAGPLPLRRLTRREYNNTVRDLLGDTTRPASQFPAESSSFIFARPGTVATQDALLIRGAAETLAANAARNLEKLVPCVPAMGDDACAKSFIQSFGLRAYRRPLAQAEVDSLMQLFTTGRAMLGLGFAGAIELVIEGVLQSPQFLYHWEVAPGPTAREGTLVKLGPYQIASQLSYFLWGTMPDKALFDAAAAGKLAAAADLEAHARRMVADANARDTVASFFHEWLDLQSLADRPKDPKLYPEYDEALKSAMVDEARSYVQGVVFDGDARLSTLLTAPYGFVNEALGPVYGVMTVKGTTMQKVGLDPTQRGGLLTQAAFLTLNGASDGSHPVRRGHAIFERLLCRHLPPPPDDVPSVKPPMPGLTTRQRFEEHDKLDCARACHSVMDPIGFAFENYDGIGRYRTTDQGKKVEANGSVELDGRDQAFANALDLSGVLAQSKEVQRCMVTQWLRYALARPETDADRASIDSALDDFSAKGGDLRELLVTVAVSRSFRYRIPSMGEVLP